MHKNVETGLMPDVQKIKRITARLAMHFVCSRCRRIMEGAVDLIKRLCDKVETVNGLYYLGARLNSNGGCTSCKEADTARVKTS